MQIIVECKSVYGNALIYPVCEKAVIFCKLLKTKTLTKDSIEHIKALGYEVKAQVSEVTL